MDPFSPSIGYNSDFPKCDLITISHNHFDHSYINEINNCTKIINTCGTYNFDFLQLKGINSFHDDYSGLKRGNNIIYIFRLENISIAHLGDLGHIPDSFVLNELNSLDFLIIPIGSNFTLNGTQAAELCNILMPRYIIPMHYKTPATNLNLDDGKKFILSMKKINKISSNLIDLSNFNQKNRCKETLLLTAPNQE